MKFRIQCAGCGATFFAPDRKARLCPKCVKKRGLKTAAVELKHEKKGPPTRGPVARPNPAPKADLKPRPAPVNRPPKIGELNPELMEQVERLYRERSAAEKEAHLDEIVLQISDKIWVSRKAVRQVLNKILHPDVPITPEIKARIIELYRGYVERSERPAGGRRRAIANVVGVPFRQVMRVVYEWSQAQYSQSPTPDLTREQRFEVEKAYWEEIDRKRHRYGDLPAKIAERLGFVTPYQVSRWLDTLHDDQGKFDKVADVALDVEQQILDSYRQYLAAAQPPKQGLHATVANRIGGTSGRQVHKVLQRYRYRMREEYPLK
jgi:hypothetical protein